MTCGWRAQRRLEPYNPICQALEKSEEAIQNLFLAQSLMLTLELGKPLKLSSLLHWIVEKGTKFRLRKIVPIPAQFFQQ
jgi:hypothetical protein